MITVDVIVESGPPLKSIFFVLDPSNCGFVWLMDNPVFPSTSGTSHGGVLVSFGGDCLTPPIHVLSVTYLVGSGGPSPGQCCKLLASGGAWGCADEPYTVDMGEVKLASDCGSYVPHDPYPPDGAVDVPASLDLRWTASYAVACGPCVTPNSLYLATVNPPSLYWVDVTSPCHVDLQPGTTYYWQIKVVSNFWPGLEGPVWSFTTAGSTVPAAETTWGKIKALYGSGE